jgi:hypothetical protein
MLAHSPILTGRKTMAVKLEVIVDRSVGGEKLLRIAD